MCDTCTKHKVCYIKRFISDLPDVNLTVNNCKEYVKDMINKQENKNLNDEAIMTSECSICHRKFNVLDLTDTLDGKTLCDECYYNYTPHIDYKYFK